MIWHYSGVGQFFLILVASFSGLYCSITHLHVYQCQPASLTTGLIYIAGPFIKQVNIVNGYTWYQIYFHPKLDLDHRSQVISIITERLYDPSHHGWSGVRLTTSMSPTFIQNPMNMLEQHLEKSIGTGPHCARVASLSWTVL